MPLVFEQPNLDHPEQNHLYCDPGEGALPAVPITSPMSIWPTPSRRCRASRRLPAKKRLELEGDFARV
jgi:hypothetical protein